MYNAHIIEKYRKIQAELKAIYSKLSELETRERDLKQDLQLLRDAYPRTSELIEENFYDAAPGMKVGLSIDEES